MFQSEIDLSDSVFFISQLTVVLLFSTMIIGFVIKKMLQIIKG